MKIQFYFDDHPPPHFHAILGERRVEIEIETLRVHGGSLPKAKLDQLRAWARSRLGPLREAWLTCEEGRNPGKVE
jgi:Domain of unknown function (DUF4160)